MARTPKPEPGKQVAVPNNPGIYKRTTKAGEVEYLVRVWDPAQQKRVNYPAVKSLKDAQKVKRDAEAEKEKRAAVDKIETVADWADRWMQLHGSSRAESTRRHYEERIRAFVKDFGARPLASIRRAEADLWVRGGPAPKDLLDVVSGWSGVDVQGETVIVPAHRSNAATVRAMFNDARKSGLIENSPFAQIGVEKARGRKDIQVPDFRGDDLDELVRIAGEKHGLYGRHVFGPMILIAAWTGLRPGELYALTPADVDLDAKDELGEPDPKLHVRRQWNSKLGRATPTKNQQRREVALLKPAIEAFRRLELDTLPQDEPIFKTAKGKQFGQSHLHFYWNPVRAAFAESRSANHWLRERLRNDEKNDFDFYELRHLFGTRLAEMGASPYDIADQMGHQDGGKLAMSTYIHVRSANSRRRIRALEDLDADAA